MALTDPLYGVPRVMSFVAISTTAEHFEVVAGDQAPHGMADEDHSCFGPRLLASACYCLLGKGLQEGSGVDVGQAPVVWEREDLRGIWDSCPQVAEEAAVPGGLPRILAIRASRL